ncbi:MAG: hypothetical protein R3234_04640 [Thermoanaerobaculia bacterium]|nr:hypothetical protein [Thermoanaerobaculia bacterium]
MVTIQKTCWWASAVLGLVILGTATGYNPVPTAATVWLGVAYPFLLGVGVLFGWMARLRQVEIEEDRWRILSDEHLTRGERTYAHKEAESAMTRSLAAFLLVPLLLAGYLTYQIPGEEGSFVNDLLVLPAFLGYGLGLLLGWWKTRNRSGPHRPPG